MPIHQTLEGTLIPSASHDCRPIFAPYFCLEWNAPPRSASATIRSTADSRKWSEKVRTSRKARSIGREREGGPPRGRAGGGGGGGGGARAPQTSNALLVTISAICFEVCRARIEAISA